MSLLFGGPDPLQHFHVAGVGCIAVEDLGCQRVLAEFGCDVGVVEVGQAFTGFGVGQEEVPQAPLLRLGLQAFHDVELFC